MKMRDMNLVAEDSRVYLDRLSFLKNAGSVHRFKTPAQGCYGREAILLFGVPGF